MSAPDDAAEPTPDAATGPTAAPTGDGAGPRPGRPGSPATWRLLAIGVCGVLIVVLAAALLARNLGDDGAGDDVEQLVPGTAGTPVRQGAPDVDAMLDTVIREADATETSLRDLLGGRPLLVNLWSRTCTPCIREMPWLEQVNRDDPRVQVVGVNQHDQLGKARELAEQTGVTYPWYLDGAGDVGWYGRSSGLPDTYLFAPDGRLLGAKLGAFADEAALRAWLDDHLAGL